MSVRRLVPIVGILLLVASQAPSATLSDILVRKVGETTQVVLSLDSPVTYRDFTLAAPDRIVVDCDDLVSALRHQSFRGIGRGGVTGIDISRFGRANLLRVVVRLTGDVPHSLSYNSDDLVIALATGSDAPFEEWRATEAKGANPTSAVYTSTSAASRVHTDPIGDPQLIKETFHAIPGTTGETLISMDLEQADILTALRALGEYGGRDIIAGPEVKGTVTMTLHDVPWRRALELVVKTTGFAFVEEDNIIRVTTAAKLARERAEMELAEPLVHRVYKLEFASPGEIRGPLTRMLSTRGSIETDDRTSSVVVSDIPPAHDKVAKLVSILDSKTPQVEIRVKVVDIDYAASKGLGINWTLQGLRSRKYNVEGDLTVANPAGGVAGWSTFNVGTVRSFAQIDAVITALEDENKSETVANPRVTVVNNKTASIVGGKRFSITVLDQRGNPITQLYTVGTKLEVTPNINSLDEVTMDIHSELSEVDEATIATGRPVMTTSEADTRQLVRDGETVVLGGFIREKRTKSESGVPILRSIPLIGLLFKDTSWVSAKREVLIFLTPHIIKKTD